MTATFFVDENDLALGKALAKLHGNVFFPGHPDLPAVSAFGTGPSRSGCGWKTVCAALFSPGRRAAAGLGLLEDHWEAMATIVEVNLVGPWMYAITEPGVRAIVLS